MKQAIKFLLSIMLLNSAIAQDISIYHGTGGQSTIFLDKKDANISSWKDSAVFIKKGKEIIEIVVLNPNPLFYSYELKIDEFEIKDEFPDVTDLLGGLNSILSLASSSGSEKFLSAAPSKITKAYNVYSEAIDSLAKDIRIAHSALLNSDFPETKNEAFLYADVGGYRGAQKIIRTLPSSIARFNSQFLLAELDALSNSAVEDSTLNVNMKDLLKKSFLQLNRHIVQTITEVRKSVQAEPIIRYNIRVSGKNLKIHLIVRKKEGHKDKIRMEFEKLICVIIPEYERSLIELIPVVNLTYSSSVPEFAIHNGLIKQNKGDGFKFRVGAMLIYNFLHFGKYNEGAIGAGLGYNIPQKGVLDGFYVGSLLSYKNTFRIGVGTGFSSYPEKLKNDLLPGMALPDNIKNIEEIVTYRKKFSFFISLSLSGITVLKK